MFNTTLEWTTGLYTGVVQRNLNQFNIESKYAPCELWTTLTHAHEYLQ